MKVRVQLFALYREKAGQQEVEVEVPGDATVADLLRDLEEKLPALRGRCQAALIAVNLEYADRSRPLAPTDEVALIPPVSGGAISLRVTARITTEPLDPRAVADSLKRPANGAVVTFEGVVRDNNLGRAVWYLEYEAYPAMAERMLQRIGQEVGERWGAVDVALWHRTGRLEIGETSLVVAVASPHRREGFAACQEMVDKVKELVPVWKKEVWKGGEQWLEGD
ncbi:MAG: molybdenum cofactor biosynthesis protein MoaE [Chloroflexi bacterium]|nr:molybdenum cofactor biosynthesis protein MoaE [Chloroflexota bacterium]